MAVAVGHPVHLVHILFRRLEADALQIDIVVAHAVGGGFLALQAEARRERADRCLQTVAPGQPYLRHQAERVERPRHLAGAHGEVAGTVVVNVLHRAVIECAWLHAHIVVTLFVLQRCGVYLKLHTVFLACHSTEFIKFRNIGCKITNYL